MHDFMARLMIKTYLPIQMAFQSLFLSPATMIAVILCDRLPKITGASLSVLFIGNQLEFLFVSYNIRPF